jgi:hypothetical protein
VGADVRERGRESWRIYRLQLGLGAAGLAAATLTLADGVRSVRVHPASAHRLAVAGVDLTYPAVNAAAIALLALAALGAAVIVIMIRAALRQVRAHRRMTRDLPVIGPMPDHPAVLVIDSPAPAAFCAGWLRPRVYISSGVLDRLSPGELRAVLAHEQHHGALRDPLRLAISRVLCQALFFLPALRSLESRYADAAELTADAAALRASEGAPGPVASAMLLFGSTDGGDVVGIHPDRVDALLGLSPATRLPRMLLLASLLTIAALIAIAWRASASASIQTSLNLPIASSQPCVLVLALVPFLLGVVLTLTRRAS